MTVQFAISPAQSAASVRTASSPAGDRTSFGDDASFMSFESVLSDSLPQSDDVPARPKMAPRRREASVGSEETTADADPEQSESAAPVTTAHPVVSPDPPLEETVPAAAGQSPLPQAVPAENTAAAAALVSQTITALTTPAIPLPGAVPDSAAGATVPVALEAIAPATDKVPIAASPKPEMVFAAHLQATPVQGSETEQVDAGSAHDSASEPPARASVKVFVSEAEPVAAKKSLPQETERHTPESNQLISRAEPTHWIGTAPARMETVRASAPQTTPVSEVREVALPLEKQTGLEPAHGPIREIRLNLAEPGQGRTELRLMDRDGNVGLAVRTDNPEVATALRGNLNDLTHRLERLGYSTEVWSPQGAQEPLHAAARKSQGADQQKQSGQDGTDRQKDDDGGGQRRQQQRPHWMNEFESIMGASQQ